jgi:hypothetical protein
VPIASFHLVRHRNAAVALRQLSLGRRALATTPGLRFWRNLGTGSGDDTGPGADLQRTALFAIWDDVDALERFRSTAWPTAREHWSVCLTALGGHGTWRDVDVLATIDRADPAIGLDDAPTAIITRANVKLSRWRRFAAAGPGVNTELHAAPGLIDVVGIGEAPIGRQGTFSLWESAGAARRFSTSGEHHRAVIRRTRSEGWYGEEMFARFHPLAACGTWNGRDPLSAAG